MPIHCESINHTLISLIIPLCLLQELAQNLFQGILLNLYEIIPMHFSLFSFFIPLISFYALIFGFSNPPGLLITVIASSISSLFVATDL